MDSNIESAFKPSGKLTPVEGGIIHWQKQGSGPSLVLIHGLLGNSNNFNELAKNSIKDCVDMAEMLIKIKKRVKLAACQFGRYIFIGF